MVILRFLLILAFIVVVDYFFPGDTKPEVYVIAFTLMLTASSIVFMFRKKIQFNKLNTTYELDSIFKSAYDRVYRDIVFHQSIIILYNVAFALFEVPEWLIVIICLAAIAHAIKALKLELSFQPDFAFIPKEGSTTVPGSLLLKDTRISREVQEFTCILSLFDIPVVDKQTIMRHLKINIERIENENIFKEIEEFKARVQWSHSEFEKGSYKKTDFYKSAIS